MDNINISEIFESINDNLDNLKRAIVIKDDTIETKSREIRGLVDTIACSTYSANTVRLNLLEQIKKKKLNHKNYGEIVTIEDIENIVNKLNEEEIVY